MIRLIRSFTPAVRVLLIVALLVPSVPSPAGAAPNFIGFTVNSNLDTNSADTVLTLREAILVDIGGTGASGLNRPATAGEQAQLAACTFDGFGNVTVGCGAGVTDSIRFLSSYTITLTSLLPVLSDNGTSLNGLSMGAPNINANGVGQVLNISGNYINIQGLHVYGSYTGTSNIFIQNPAQAVVIANNFIGSADDQLDCALSTNSYGGIYVSTLSPLVGGNAHAWIYGNHITCNLGDPGDGITLDGTNNVVIGADKLGNSTGLEQNQIYANHNGIRMIDGANFNFVRNSLIAINNVGVWINASNSNIVKECLIQWQVQHGVQIDGGSQNNRIGSPLGGPTTAGNVMVNNTLDGAYLSGAATSGNAVYGNRIGTLYDGVTAAGNLRNGVTVDNGAHDNLIGATQAERNIISGNTGDGIQILNGAHDNMVQGNIIGVNLSGTLPRPNLSGIAIFAGAYNNTVGGNVTANLNLIAGNSAYGIYIGDSSTTTNTVNSNDIGYNSLGGGSTGGISLPNGWDGIRISGARHNRIGSFNLIGHNGGSGIALDSDAGNNPILDNEVFSNAGYGIILDGASTGFNRISGDVIDHNGFDGIGERNGAGSNLWTGISTHDNGGLAIDRFADFGDTVNIVDGPFPEITGVSVGGGMVTITGTHTSGLAVEVYAVATDPSGYGEGKVYLGATPFAAGTTWTLSLAGSTLGCYTAFEHGLFSSTEFGPNSCRTLLPLIRR